MTNNTPDKMNFEESLNAVQLSLSSESLTESNLCEAGQELSRFADVAKNTSRTKLHKVADLLARVLDLAACLFSQFPSDASMVDELVGFVKQHLPLLEKASHSSSYDRELELCIEAIETKWKDCLSLLEDDFQSEDWDRDSSIHAEQTPETGADEDVVSLPDGQINLLLSAISDSSSDSMTRTVDHDVDKKVLELDEQDDDGQQQSDESAKLELANDRELLEAYLDDAGRCLSSMEKAALEFEASPDDEVPVQQFCRELHTLKGASASVGLSKLASYLHDVESSLEQEFAEDSGFVKAESLFAAVDRVRDEIATFQQGSAPVVPAGSPRANMVADPVTGNSEFANFATDDDSSIRIRATKLDRLMDMLAELVVLRNRRESHGSEFDVFNDELERCATRLKFAEENSGLDFRNDSDHSNLYAHTSSSTFSEVGKDISVVSQGLRDLQKPVSQDNAAISRFIHDFRQELMQLRRVPVSGLFNRLQRAARDAAKTENKQVQVNVVGEFAGLEQEIQERLFEPLLHIVRNSVSHGIESAENRISSGKSPAGVVTLEAYSSTQLLIIEVSDDGRGLNYEAIQQKAIEHRLLGPNQRPSKDELAKLIFSPGFSTCQTASKVSGRGVGMDVAAKTIEQVHGRIEVDSIPEQGTTIRLLIPLRTGIEHVMVFRADGQLFALPLQSVTAARSSNANIGKIAKLSLSSAVSSNGKNETESEDVLLLRGVADLRDRRPNHGPMATNMQLALAVDELIGPEEVVVRGMPNLLKRHPLFCGVTLSGSGEKVLLLDSQRVLEFCHHYNASESRDVETIHGVADADKTPHKKRVLVVDDSLTARRALVKLLQRHDFATVESGDGIEAIERLHKEHFDLVLTDLDMPRLGGLELLSDIQSCRYTDSPVVVVSSRDEEAFRTKAMDFGAVEYVTKPVSETSITQLLESLQLLPATLKG